MRLFVCVFFKKNGIPDEPQLGLSADNGFEIFFFLHEFIYKYSYISMKGWLRLTNHNII